MLHSETTRDQAAGLRQMIRPHNAPIRVIAVSGGKGGVGKTTVSINTALALAQAGRQVMIMDADLGLANVDVLLGLHPRYNLSHVLAGERTLEEVMIEGPGGIRIVPGASGIQRMAELSSAEHAGLIRAFSELTVQPEFLIIDTAAGISDAVICFASAAQYVMMVVCDEPASITDAYALIKLLSREHGVNRFHVVANMARSPQEGRDLYTKLTKVTDRFLDVLLEFVGTVPFDEYLRKAVQRQRAVVDAYPRSRAAAAFTGMAKAAANWPVPSHSGGRLEFFVERLIRLSLEQKEQAV